MTDAWPPKVKRTEVDGVAVVEDVVLASSLTKTVGKVVPIKGTRELTLADGSVTYGCADCLFHGTRGEVGVHRSAEHPAPPATPKRGRPPKTQPFSAELRDMKFGEVLELAVLAVDSEAQFARLEARIEELTTELADTTTQLRAVEKAYGLQTNRLKKLVEG